MASLGPGNSTFSGQVDCSKFVVKVYHGQFSGQHWIASLNQDDLPTPSFLFHELSTCQSLPPPEICIKINLAYAFCEIKWKDDGATIALDVYDYW
jgi:hypothetical protein